MVNPFNVTSVYMAGIVWVLMLIYWICVCFYVFVGFNLFIWSTRVGPEQGRLLRRVSQH
jgi:succinate dehydrogenase/fumarate reductase cytochrome b subunit